jgi:citrate synthase
MAMVATIVASLAAFYHDSTDISDDRHREIFSHRIVAKLPTVAAAAYKHALGQPFMYPRNDLDYTANMLHMFFAVPCEPYEVDELHSKALDLLFILHADHEQNASTSTVRLAGSTGCNPYTAMSAGVSALWGPAHGGANEAVVDMLEKIGDAAHVPEFLSKVKDSKGGVRLMGFGHRVYKNFDPRATIIREMCHRVLGKLGQSDNPLFELALKLEEVALKDDYFVSRKLYPNVDFYSGIIYRALGIPREMFTVMFAIARTAGWVAHWSEMISDPEMKIARPRQLYTGPTRRDYVPAKKRGGNDTRGRSLNSEAELSERPLFAPVLRLHRASRAASAGRRRAPAAPGGCRPAGRWSRPPRARPR